MTEQPKFKIPSKEDFNSHQVSYFTVDLVSPFDESQNIPHEVNTDYFPVTLQFESYLDLDDLKEIEEDILQFGLIFYFRNNLNMLDSNTVPDNDLLEICVPHFSNHRIYFHFYNVAGKCLSTKIGLIKVLNEPSSKSYFN